MATPTLSQSTLIITLDNAHTVSQFKSCCQPQKRTPTPVHMPSDEFRLKVLKRILSVEKTMSNNKTLQNLQHSSNDRTLQANMLFQNGDIETLISFDSSSGKDANTETLANEKREAERLPPIKPVIETKSVNGAKGEKRERPLKFMPIILPPIYTLSPRVLIVRDFSSPTLLPPPLCEEDWKDLEDCRYLRPVKKQFKKGKQNQSLFI